MYCSSACSCLVIGDVSSRDDGCVIRDEGLRVRQTDARTHRGREPAFLPYHRADWSRVRRRLMYQPLEGSWANARAVAVADKEREDKCEQEFFGRAF